MTIRKGRVDNEEGRVGNEEGRVDNEEGRVGNEEGRVGNEEGRNVILPLVISSESGKSRCSRQGEGRDAAPTVISKRSEKSRLSLRGMLSGLFEISPLRSR